MTREALHAFLTRLRARSRLTDAEEQAILGLPGRIEEVRRNRDVVRLGEVVDATCLIVEGLVGRFGQTRDGARQIAALHIPGDMPDLHSLVLPRASSALTALANSTVMRVPHSAIEEIATRYPEIAKALWRDCVVDTHIIAERILNIGRRKARARLAHLLCEMAARYEQIGQCVGLSFTFPATQEHLADALGLTPVHVNRMLAALKRAKIVSMTRHVVTIHDWNALAGAADFDVGYLHLDNAVPVSLPA